MPVALGIPVVRRPTPAPVGPAAGRGPFDDGPFDDGPFDHEPFDHGPGAAPRPDSPALLDRFGRVSSDLRVSLTDRCTLRCGYCMPAEGLQWLASEQVLTDDEVLRLVRVAVQQLGVRRVRFTGGEPLLRPGLVPIVAATAALPTPHGAPVETGLTTNGLSLRRHAAALAAAGLSRVNVSLDTLRPARFAAITRRDRLHDVLDGLAAAQAEGLAPVKVNAVLQRGINDDEAPELLSWALEHGYELRFIEQMPLDAQGAWRRNDLVDAEEILTALRSRHTLRARDDRGSAPAERFDVLVGGRVVGSVGVIASVTRPFCGSCDRTRLTADGQLRSCLFSTSETDLRALLRTGADDDELARAWRANAWAKQPGHGIDAADFVQPQRPMSAIGG